MTPAQLAAELNTDPVGVGYRDPGGQLKPTAELGRLLTEPTHVANAGTPARLPRPFTVDDLLSALTPTGKAWLVALQFSDLEPIAARIRAQDRDGVARWAAVAQLSTNLSALDMTGVTGVLTATDPDPAWPATVPGPSRLESLFPDAGGVVRHADIDAALGRTP